MIKVVEKMNKNFAVPGTPANMTGWVGPFQSYLERTMNAQTIHDTNHTAPYLSSISPLPQPPHDKFHPSSDPGKH